MTDTEEEAPEGDYTGDNVSPQLLSNVEHLGISLLSYDWALITLMKLSVVNNLWTL